MQSIDNKELTELLEEEARKEKILESKKPKLDKKQIEIEDIIGRKIENIVKDSQDNILIWFTDKTFVFLRTTGDIYYLDGTHAGPATIYSQDFNVIKFDRPQALIDCGFISKELLSRFKEEVLVKNEKLKEQLDYERYLFLKKRFEPKE